MVLLYYLAIINVLAFVLYGVDKKKAENEKYRIPESRLILVAVLGGAYGAFLGMIIFHHKTRKTKFRIVVPLFLCLNVIATGFCLYSNYHIVTTEYEYKSSSVPEELDGYRIVQISDLHNQIFGIDQKGLLKRIKEQKPDIIVVTGDVVDSRHTLYGIAEKFFEGAVEIAPTYYISGNHEKWLIDANVDKYDSFIQTIEDMGVVYLDNKEVELGGLRLFGLADWSLGTDIEQIFPKVSDDDNKDSFEVLLAHEPQYLKYYSEYGADLVLTGHNHGGQIRIPGKGGLISSEFEIFPKYDAGEFKMGDTTMIISRGLGNSLAPVRINNYPEIVTVVLRK